MDQVINTLLSAGFSRAGAYYLDEAIDSHDPKSPLIFLVVGSARRGSIYQSRRRMKVHHHPNKNIISRNATMLRRMTYLVGVFTVLIDVLLAFVPSHASFSTGLRPRMRSSPTRSETRMPPYLLSTALQKYVGELPVAIIDVRSRFLEHCDSSFRNPFISQSPLTLLADAGITEEIIPTSILIPTVFFLGAISAFLYANIVYTPEIVENAERIRQEIRNEEMEKLLEVVEQHINEGNDMEELRKPLEVALNRTIEDYVDSVSKRDRNTELLSGARTFSYFTDTDTRLASVLSSSMSLSVRNDD